MRKALVVVAAACGAVLALFVGSVFFLAQRADYGWSPAIPHPAFKTRHPRVVFDEGHHNASSAGFTGRYWPFARVLRADGYALERRTGAFTTADLGRGEILVIANATGAPKPQLFGINFPIPTDKRRNDPAFTKAEVDAIRSWIEQGGSLLLIADHAPFGEAVSDLAQALGVTMHKGFVEVPGEVSDPLVFSTANGRLGDHPIITGGRQGRRIDRVMTYTGQSLDGPPGAALLLRLPASAVEAVPAEDGGLEERPSGPAQGLAFPLGRGRVVVLGEGGMVTAQVARRVPYGLNTGDNDNLRFVRNVMLWLSGES